MKELKCFLENINEAVKTPEEWIHDEDSVLVRLPGNPSVDEVMKITNGVITWTGPQDINYGDGVEFDAPIPNFVKFDEQSWENVPVSIVFNVRNQKDLDMIPGKIVDAYESIKKPNMVLKNVGIMKHQFSGFKIVATKLKNLTLDLSAWNSKYKAQWPGKDYFIVEQTGIRTPMNDKEFYNFASNIKLINNTDKATFMDTVSKGAKMVLKEFKVSPEKWYKKHLKFIQTMKDNGFNMLILPRTDIPLEKEEALKKYKKLNLDFMD